MYADDNGSSVGYRARLKSYKTEKVLCGDKLREEVVKVIKGRFAGHPNRNRRHNGVSSGLLTKRGPYSQKFHGGVWPMCC